MFDRCITIDADDTRQAVAQLGDYFANNDHINDQAATRAASNSVTS